MAIPRAKLQARKCTETARATHKKHKRHHRVNIQEDYTEALKKQIEDLKELNDRQKQQYENEIRSLKAGRAAREEQVQDAFRNCTRYIFCYIYMHILCGKHKHNIYMFI